MRYLIARTNDALLLCPASNFAKLEFNIISSTDAGVHAVKVTYKPDGTYGIKVTDTIAVKEILPEPVTAVQVQGITAEQRNITHYVDDISEFDFTAEFVEEKIEAIASEVTE